MPHSYRKSILSLLLALVILLSAASAAFAAAEPGGVDPSPIVYVIGRTTIYDDPNSPDRKILAKASKSEITAAVKEALPYAAKAALLGQWDAYADKTYGLLMQFFDGYGLDENGEVANSSGPSFSWSEDNLSRDYKSSNPYTYRFEYDARLSPLEIADELNEFVEAVERVTGKEKVSFISRCLGVNIMMSYLYKYQEPLGYAGVDSIVMYDSSFRGIEILEAGMSGNVTIEPASALAFLKNFDLDLGDETLDAVLELTLQMLEETYGLEVLTKFFEGFYSHIKYSLIRRFFMSTFATTPGYWSMVYDGYDDAKAYLFSDKGDDVKYQKLIEKLDAYRNNVQLRGETMLQNMKEAGVDIGVVCKYGFRSYPVFDGSSKLSDGITGLAKQSFGATVSDYDGTLTESYLAARTEAGYGQYLSPDKQIDASTCLFPDATWFIKNYEHDPFHDCINPLLLSICRCDNFTVADDENWPQFLYLVNSGTVVPMTEENADPNSQITHEGEATRKVAPFSFFRFLKYLFNVVKLLVQSKIAEKQAA